MRKTTGKSAKRIVALEITESDLVLACVDRDAGVLSEPRTQRMAWRQDDTPLQSEAAIRQLTESLDSLVSREKLSGSKVHIALSSDFCVTRVVAGESDNVRRELRRLRDRSAWYLSLGSGSKLAAPAIKSIDAKHQQAWMTVVNRKTLQAVERAANEAGLNVVQVEHSLTALARAIGKTGRDAEQPVLIVEINQRGVELGISYQGCLLLDYRPGGGEAAIENTAEIVRRHLKRLKRYCARHFQLNTVQIEHVLLCGQLNEVREIQSQFTDMQELTAEVFEARSIDTDWTDCEAVSHGATFATAIGVVLANLDSNSPHESPNLIEELHKGMRGPLWPSLVKLLWPAAAMLLLTIGMYVVAQMERSKCNDLEAQLANLEPRQARLTSLKEEMITSKVRLSHLQKIQSRLKNPDWSELIRTISACLPTDVGLDDLKIAKDGAMTIVGSSYSEDAVYEFVGYLKTVPFLAELALEGTQPVHLEHGQGTRFDVKCRYTGSSEYAQGASDNG